MSNNTKALDPALASSLEKKALKTLRALSQGNGIKPDAIKINHFEPKHYVCTCRSSFLLSPQVEEKTQHGRHPGEVCASKQEADQNIQQYVYGLSHDKGFHDSLKQALLNRKDLGLGLQKDDKISMTNYQKSLVWHEECQQCHGKGQTTCHQCHGNKQERCMRCDGTTKIQCIHCGSTGRLRQGGKEEQCHYCRGTGQAPCNLCHHTGKTPCRTCGARGYLSCQTCSGSGWFTHIFQVIMTVTGQSKLDPSQVPDTVKSFFNNKLSALVQSGAVQVENKDEKIQISDDGALFVQYELGFPYGDIEFRIKDKPLKAYVFGHKGKLVRLPAFLDGLIRPGLNKLEAAARNKGDIAKQLKDAGKYKIIALGLLQAARHSANRTAYVLKKKYPMGISDGAIQKIAKFADKATSDISKKPRYFGLSIGLMVSTIFFAAYILGPIRGSVENHIANSTLHIVLDALVIGLFSYISIFSSQMAAKNAMQTALGHLLPPNQRSGLIPKAGEAAYFAIGGCVLLFLVVCELSILMEANTPDWFADFRGVTQS